MKGYYPVDYGNNIKETFHKCNGHKGYSYLARDIIRYGYYFNNIYRLCREYIENCYICSQNRKNHYKKPAIIQIIPEWPRDTYQKDITVLPSNLRTDDNAHYLLSIIDQFSKFGYNYILQYKTADKVLGKFKEFINLHGKQNHLHTDNGKEFRNDIYFLI